MTDKKNEAPIAGELGVPLAVDRDPACFALVYESKDKRLCLFQDADGHITAVPAYKLA